VYSLIMKKNASKKEYILFLGDTTDELLAQGLDKIEVVRKFLNTKRFRVSDTSLSYRQINYLSDKEIIKNDRKTKNDWHKFSLKELVFLSVIKEVRTYGFGNDQLINLKRAFFEKDLMLSSDLAIMAILGGIKIILIIDDKLSIKFYTIPMFNLFEQCSKSFININLNEIVMDLWERSGKKRIKYKNEMDLDVEIMMDKKISRKELEILQIIRSKDYKKLTIRKRDGEDFLLNIDRDEKEIDYEKLLKIIKNKEYGDINITKRDGKMVNVKVEDIKKI